MGLTLNGYVIDKHASPSFVGVVDVVGHAIHHLILKGFLGHALMVHRWAVPWQEIGPLFLWLLVQW